MEELRDNAINESLTYLQRTKRRVSKRSKMIYDAIFYQASVLYGEKHLGASCRCFEFKYAQ